MPILRSKTRSESRSVEDEMMMTNRGAEVTSTPVDPSPSNFGRRNKFTFPLAPPVTCNIINIDGSSGGSSLDQSVDVSLASNDSSVLATDTPSLEESSINLNIATLHQSQPNTINSSTYATAQLLQVTTSTISTSAHMSSVAASLPTQTSQAPASHLTNLLHQAMIMSPITANASLYPGTIHHYPLFYHNTAVHVANNLVDHELILQQVLRENNCYEVEEGINNRLRIVSDLDTLIKQWVRSEGLRQGMTWRQVELVGGKVVVYGSFKLSVVDKESDLDLLCVFPRHVQREDFFVGLFESLSKKEEVSELRQLSCAFVPVIKFRYKDIDVDLTMARLSHDKIPVEDEFLQSQHVARGLEGGCLRSLNGYRATCELLRLVPNVDRFQIVLRFVKLWAKRNGIYGNMLGYLGGASWSILVAKVCQISGEAGQRGSIANLVYLFFHTFANWNWPEPVFIKKVASQPVSAWNPQLNYTDREHAMPIITSSVPQMNSAVNVSRKTCQLINAKLGTGLDTIQCILEGSKSWSCLVQPVTIFQEYEDFILICGIAKGDSCLWFGTIESKLRKLFESIQSYSTNVSSVRIWPEPHVRMEGSDYVQVWSLGIRMLEGASDEIQEPLHTFTDFVMSSAHGLQSAYERTFSVSWHHVSKDNLARFISDSELIGDISKKPSYAAVTHGQNHHQAVPTQVVTSVATLPIAYTVQDGKGLSLPHLDGNARSPKYAHPLIHHGHYTTSNLVPIYTGLAGQSLPGPSHYYGLVSPAQLHPNISQTKIHPPNSPTLSAGYIGSNAGTTMTSQMIYRDDRRHSARGGESPRYQYEAVGGFKYPPVTSVPPPPPFSPISRFTSPPPVLTSNKPCTSYPVRPVDTSRQSSQNPKRNYKKDSSSDETDRLRSVSYSSDKFPPASLALARVNHQDQLPLSISPGYTMAGVVPLVTVDTSIPPPPHPSVVPSAPPSPHLPTPPNSPVLTFDNARERTSRKGRRSPRVSISEVSDISTTLPARGSQISGYKSNIKFSFAQDNVFRY